jgi:hypothetical protein
MELIVAGATHQAVAASAAMQLIIARSPDQAIVARRAENDVVSGLLHGASPLSDRTLTQRYTLLRHTGRHTRPGYSQAISAHKAGYPERLAAGTSPYCQSSAGFSFKVRRTSAANLATMGTGSVRLSGV